MCVILVCPDETVRPERDVLDACNAANPHGAGVAWREGGHVRWMKNLEPDDLEALLPELPDEIVIHFRWASVGGVDADLCHPFPVTRKAETDLFGTAEAVLFHNGTWGAYDVALRRLTTERGKRIPRGPMSDTRAAALCAHVHGRRVLSKLPGRWVWMDGTQTRLYGDWEKYRGMLASNLHFVRRMLRVPDRDWPGADESLTGLCQSELWSCEPAPNGAANGATPRATASSLFS